MPRLRTLLAAGALCAVVALPVAAQQVPGAELGQVLISRRSLEDLAARLEQTAESRSFSNTVRNSARAQAALVRTRLQEGDFQVGDRIQLHVDNETTLTTTFPVLAGRQVALPGVGLLPMAGVLRVELAEHVTRFLGQYLRDPKVRALSLIRVVVVGGVTRQGFITVPVDIPMDSVFGLAGGLSATANIDKMKIQRDGETLYEGPELQRVISEGSTLDALGIQQGDRIDVPVTPPANPLQRLQIFNTMIGLFLSIYAIVQIFKP
jgi:protein involved in polysaccharide export with SLBB domain